MINRVTAFLILTLIAITMSACEPIGPNADQSTRATNAQLTIEAAPVQDGENSWKIATGDTVTLTVSAPGAQSVRILYRPIIETDHHVLLKTISSPTDNRIGSFSSGLKLVPDFAGEVWAEVSYPDGTKKETQPIELAAQNSAVAQPATNGANGTANKNGSARNGESAQSDKFTGGKIEQALLQPGQPDIKITVNVPAFRLTLWQNGKEVKTYEIGVGMKKYPIVIGERKVSQVIWNPEWVPPDSEWVNEGRTDVEPGEHVEADDPRNPLGKLKIPLGDGFLIHQATKASDLGHLVSHGCIRMLKDDIADLANKIVAARALNITPQQIDHAMKSSDRLSAALNPPIVINIDYDTLVVQGGVLHIYPDVYGRDSNTPANVRDELKSVGVDASRLDDQTLKQMLDRANVNEEFQVNLADITSGNALLAGANRPLTTQSAITKKPKTTKGRQGAGGRR